MGLGAYLWREGDVSVMEVTLARRSKVCPQSPWGIVASLLDETMGLVLAIHEVLA